MDPDHRESDGFDPDEERPMLQRKWEFEDPLVRQMRGFRRNILLWVAVVGVFVALGGVWVRSSADDRARNRAYRAALVQDVERLAGAQRAYFAANGKFASLAELGIDFISSQGIRVRMLYADSMAWSATAWHLAVSYECTVADSAPRRGVEPSAPAPSCR